MARYRICGYEDSQTEEARKPDCINIVLPGPFWWWWSDSGPGAQGAEVPQLDTPANGDPVASVCEM